MNDISGIIYSLNIDNYNLLKKRKKPIFIKYTTNISSNNPTRLKKGDYLYFYLSKQNKKIIGYSKIKEIMTKTPNEVEKYYLKKIQMNKTDFINYIKNRESKPLLLFVLEKIIDLKKQIDVKYPIAMSGKYIHKSEIDRYKK